MVARYTESDFRSMIDTTEDTSLCWLWKRRLDSDGYGIIRYQNVTYKAHRLAYKLWVGELDSGMCVCHRCDIRNCCNPHHLFLGTSQENTADRDRKNRQSRGDRVPYENRPRGSRSGSSKLTESQALEIRSLCDQGQDQYLLAEKFGVTQSTVSKIYLRKTWRHL